MLNDSIVVRSTSGGAIGQIDLNLQEDTAERPYVTGQIKLHNKSGPDFATLLLNDDGTATLTCRVSGKPVPQEISLNGPSKMAFKIADEKAVEKLLYILQQDFPANLMQNAQWLEKVHLRLNNERPKLLSRTLPPKVKPSYSPPRTVPVFDDNGLLGEVKINGNISTKTVHRGPCPKPFYGHLLLNDHTGHALASLTLEQGKVTLNRFDVPYEDARHVIYTGDNTLPMDGRFETLVGMIGGFMSYALQEDTGLLKLATFFDYLPDYLKTLPENSIKHYATLRAAREQDPKDRTAKKPLGSYRIKPDAAKHVENVWTRDSKKPFSGEIELYDTRGELLGSIRQVPGRNISFLSPDGGQDIIIEHTDAGNDELLLDQFFDRSVKELAAFLLSHPTKDRTTMTHAIDDFMKDLPLRKELWSEAEQEASMGR